MLDSISLTNLEVFQNNFDNTQAGTLYEQVDFCNTAFGKRLLKYWIVNPLCDPEAINDRLNAVDDLKQIDEKFSTIKDMLKVILKEYSIRNNLINLRNIYLYICMYVLKALPDLERLISKIHQLGNVGKNHPDSRAIMYENDTYRWVCLFHM